MGGKSSKPKDKSKPTSSTADSKKKADNKKVDNKKVPKIPTLSDDEINLLTSNTKFTRDEIISIHKDFFKDCPSGRINKKDFAKLFKSLHPLENKKSKADSYCEFAFNAFDKNHDSYIDFNEFCVAFSVTSSGDIEQRVRFAFRHFDSDRDEKINKNDLLKVINSLYDLNGIPASARKGNNDPKKRVDEVMKKLDVNKKNSLTLNEFVDGCLNDQQIKEFLVDSLFSNSN